MEFDEVAAAILSFDELLSEKWKDGIHYRSMKNFIRHFDEIKSEAAKGRICNFLSDYVEEVRAHHYDFSQRGERLMLARKYLLPIADYYKEDSKFMQIPTLKYILATGILGDGFLYITGLSTRIWHWPVVTTIQLLYYFFILIFKKPDGRVYGFSY